MLLWGLIALASADWEVQERTYFGESLGWSPDGRYVAVEMVTDRYTHYHHYGVWRTVLAWDTWTGEQRTYQGEFTLNPDPPNNDEDPTVPPPSSWEALPPLSGLPAFTGELVGDGTPNGCGEANLEPRLELAREMEGFARAGNTSGPNTASLVVRDATALFRLSARRAGQDWMVYEHIQGAAGSSFMDGYSSWTWVYAPNCSRAVLVSHVAGQEGSRDGYEPDGATAEVEIIDLGPRVDVMAHPSHQALIEPAAKALAQKGWAVSLTGAAKARRAETVVYAWSRAKAAAEAVASDLPGGAKVDKLSWKTSADVVVALGSPD